jgi:anaphase-promoting complex subunit 3
MSPPPSGVNAQLRQLIHYHLDNGFVENALFLAGRLHALEPRNLDAIHLLAHCNLRLGRYKAAYDYSKTRGLQGQHLGCAYVFAQACLGLEKYDQGVTALEKARSLWTGRNHWSKRVEAAVFWVEMLTLPDKHSETSRRHVPDAAACSCMLGKLYAAHGDTQKAIDNYVAALKINSFMWDAFTGLCDLGAAVRPHNIFKITPEMLASIVHSSSNGATSSNAQAQEISDARNPFVSTPDVDPFNPLSRQSADIGLNLGGANLLSRLNGSAPMVNGVASTYHNLDTPVANGQDYDEDVMMGEAGGPVMNEQGPEVVQAPPRKTRLHFNGSEEPPKMRPITSRSRTKTNPEIDQTDIPRPINQNGHKRTISGHATQHTQVSSAQAVDPAAPPRRSVRLLNSVTSFSTRSSRLANASSKDQDTKERRELRKVKAMGTKGKPGTTSTVGRVVSGNRNPTMDTSETAKPGSRPTSAAAHIMPPPRMGPSSDLAREQEALSWLLDLLWKIGSGYKYLSRFDSKRALDAFKTVPTAQRETPWVLAQIGKAHYEREEYQKAEDVFQKIRDKAPAFLDHMEVYSNTLWQLKREVPLGYLAHTLMEQDRLSPQAWCALGNANSLDQQHDDAIKCFSRATQLDPKFAYAFTLRGHEHVTNEEYEKAMSAFRGAISADSRHYNGWYGLGTVFEKMGKLDFAEKHYRKAAEINPNNATILVKIGLVSHITPFLVTTLTRHRCSTA